MPIVIKELIIKAKVEEEPSVASSGAGSNAMKKVENKEAFIAACVEQVLEILDKRKER